MNNVTVQPDGSTSLDDTERLATVVPTVWTFQLLKRPSVVLRVPLALEWEPNGASRAYDEGLTGWDAWDDWRTFDDIRIYWFVTSRPREVFESAPFPPEGHYSHRPNNFLDYYSWPVDDYGRRLRWTDLPVVEGKSEWMYALTGWRPAPCTPTVPVAALESQR